MQATPSLPRPLLSGLVWQQSSGLFARWKEVFLILTKDCMRCHKISSAKSSQFGSLVFSLDLVLVSDVRCVERRGYLTLVVEGQGMARTYFRRTDGIREWGRVIQEQVLAKKEEFDRYLSPSHLMRYPVLPSSTQDTWLLSRLSPNSGCKENTNIIDATEDQNKVEDNDSGLESATNGDEKECLVKSDEMQEVRLNMRGRNCRNVLVPRPKIPPKLCKVTKV